VRINSLTFALSTFLVVGVAGSAAGQQRTPPTAAPATMDDVLNELRAVRTELRESSAATLRVQLLVARLQLQEQRINTVWRQLSEVEDKLQANEKNRAAPEQILKMMGLEPGAEPPKEMASLVEMFKNQMAVSEKADSDLKLRQTELMQLMTQEQSRWTAFNAQLETLEQALTAVAPRR
jgi:DNA repair exonuclease SbcCD ATPase subunit